MGEMKLNEPERQKLGRYTRSPVSRHSMQSHIRTYYWLRKGEPLIALGSHQGRWLNFCIRGTHRGAGNESLLMKVERKMRQYFVMAE